MSPFPAAKKRLAPQSKCLAPNKCLAPQSKCLAPNKYLAPNKCLAPQNKCLAPHNKCLAPTSAGPASFATSLLGSSAALWFFIASYFVLTASTAVADEPPEQPPPPVRSETMQLAWADVIDAVLPGLVLDVAPWPGGTSDSDGLAVLLRPEDPDDASTQLFRLQGGQADLTPVAIDLPQDLDSLHRHGEQLWLGEEGAIYRFTEASGLTPLIALEGLTLEGLVQRGLITEEHVLIPEVGNIRQYTTDFQPTDTVIEMPVEARRHANRIRLWSPPIRRLEDGRRWVSDPESTDSHRFRVTTVDLEAADDERLQESWLRFAGPEDVEQSHFVHIDGRPAVIVATTRGDKLGVFEKLKVRTFLLKSDRTRAGRLPRNQLETVTRHWYRVEPLIVDFDGNGKDDMLLIQPDGLMAGSLKVELHLGRGSGLLEPRSRRSKIDAESAGWDMTTDFTGDGAPDLLLVSEGELRLYAGLPRHKKRVVDSEPVHRLGAAVLSEGSVQVSVELSESGSDGAASGIFSAPRLLQLDSDTRPEIVLVQGVRGRGVVRVVDVK